MGHFPLVVKRHKAVILWVLIACFLTQPVMLSLSPALLSHDQQGEPVVLCSINGNKIVYVDNQGQLQHQQHECPIWQLLLATSSALTSDVSLHIWQSFAVIEVMNQTIQYQHNTFHFLAYTSRGPPQV